jgi:hypothetical protein
MSFGIIQRLRSGIDQCPAIPAQTSLAIGRALQIRLASRTTINIAHGFATDRETRKMI